jgi:hypothetical protein
MKRRLVVEIVISPVDRQFRRRQGDEKRAWTALLDVPVFTRRKHDDFVAEARCGLELCVNVGSNASALGRIKGANVNNPHR